MLSYSGLRNYEKATLPVVVGYNGSMNIIKDLPKGYMIPIREKVGQNSFITQQIENSADRFSEAISYYPRGVNPAVNVNYNNNGGVQAKLPYRIMKDGAFRAPLIKQTDLLPLSRQKRSEFSININPMIVDDTKIQKYMINPDAAREIRKEIISTEYFQTEFPENPNIFQRNYDHQSEIKVIDQNNSNLVNIESGKIYIPKNIEYILELKKYIQEQPIIEIQTNKSSSKDGKIQIVDISLPKEILHSENQMINKKFYPQIFENNNNFELERKIPNVEISTFNKKFYPQIFENNNNFELERKNPIAEIQNLNVIPKNFSPESKTKNLREKIHPMNDTINRGNMKSFNFTGK